ncbi:response regulator transcription factor [Sediminibacterium sp.]|uniref:response regulator transcription factor n=1 Tax=Sediminibacterium sp. TaxID=1917865 RepID=UPI0027281A62|nr:response regulator transcription factor [Sediminibacterium sp.]MDO8997811.1 response regulator transcription factor [Sediminibacterium sp.]MDP2421652.1 response regulator transcription factor [Sediminibacterium sp.]
MIKALLLEDEPTIAHEISSFLKAKDIACDIVFDGDIFLKYNKNNIYDIYLLDINVPKINGLDICQIIRENNKEIPIIMITALGEITDKKIAFQLGADDYLVKPFLLEELVLRIEALIRRKQIPQINNQLIKIVDLSIDIVNKKVWRSNKEIKLTPKEFKLLVILANANGRVLSKQQIAEVLWDYHIKANENTIEVYINFLRNKIDKFNPIKLIHTKVGFGYYLKKE